MMNSKEVEENAAAADMPLLNAEEQASVEHIYATHQFYDPKAKGL
jgi:hypothetical protein